MQAARRQVVGGEDKQHKGGQVMAAKFAKTKHFWIFFSKCRNSSFTNILQGVFF